MDNLDKIRTKYFEKSVGFTYTKIICSFLVRIRKLVELFSAQFSCTCDCYFYKISGICWTNYALEKYLLTDYFFTTFDISSKWKVTST